MSLRSRTIRAVFPSSARFTSSLVVTALCVLALLLGLLEWSGRAVDRIERTRDRATIALLLHQSVDRLAHTQESSTVWDEAVRELRRSPVNGTWVDHNLGLWFYKYGGVDEVYVLSPQDIPLYAMSAGRRLEPDAYARVRGVAGPLVARLRRDHAIVKPRTGEAPLLAPGQSDFALVSDRPAIVSVKPVVTDTGDLPQAPGTEAVHIAVVFLDRGYFGRLGDQYGLAGVRYEKQPSAQPGMVSVALVDRGGRLIGHLVWKPFAPGSRVTSSLGPVLLVGVLLLTIAIYSLATRLARRTSDLEQSRLQAQHQATHDGLTGLANRAMFEMRLEEALARSRRHRSLVALLYLDLDRFKQVNDTLGHPAGDALIRQVARRLVGQVREYDMVARLGGDEFAVLITEPMEIAVIERICARIVAEMERPFDLSGSQAYIGASIGVALAPDHGLDRTELTRKADIALYKAKVSGRSRHVVFTADLDADVRLREASYRELRQALVDRDQQFEVHYQPTFATATGEIMGMEALLRWRHPDLGLVSPDRFIRSAEESGLIEELGEWVLHRVLEDAAAWPDLRIAVNVSPIQLRSRGFVETVRRALEQAHFPAGRLELELTETALMSASDDVAQTLRDLRRLGVACALDDFGTGYSSLSHIRDFAVDRIKIDRSFVQAIDTVQGAALVEAIVGLARANGLQLTAEGVETEAQRTFLDRVGCHEVQGFLMARPMPARQLTALLEAGVPADRDRRVQGASRTA